MNIEITRIARDQKETFLNLYNLYLYDLSEFTLEDPTNSGMFDPTNTYIYLEKDELHPYFIVNDSKIIGFILVCAPPFVPEDVDYTVQELFILKKYRGTNIASITVEKVLGQLSGKISICQLAANQRAVAFWKKYYREHHIDYVETRECIPIDGLEGLQEVISQSFEIQRTC